MDRLSTRSLKDINWAKVRKTTRQLSLAGGLVIFSALNVACDTDDPSIVDTKADAVLQAGQVRDSKPFPTMLPTLTP